MCKIIPDNINVRDLCEKSLEARNMAYAPYSNYHVGAALLCKDGALYQGGNIENSSYGATNCAERTAIFKAVSEGKREFSAIAISGGLKDSLPTDYAYPCGICRQVMSEFCGKDFVVIVVKSVEDYKVYNMDEILPNAFLGDSIR